VSSKVNYLQHRHLGHLVFRHLGKKTLPAVQVARDFHVAVALGQLAAEVLEEGASSFVGLGFRGFGEDEFEIRSPHPQSQLLLADDRSHRGEPKVAQYRTRVFPQSSRLEGRVDRAGVQGLARFGPEGQGALLAVDFDRFLVHVLHTGDGVAGDAPSRVSGHLSHVEHPFGNLRTCPHRQGQAETSDSTPKGHWETARWPH